MRIYSLIFALLLPGCVIGGEKPASQTSVSHSNGVFEVHSNMKNNYTTLSTYIFGHSLIDHAAGSETNVPIWMSALARRAGFKYAVDGQFGFLLSHARFPVRPNWGYEGVTSAWDSTGATSFADANYDAILLTPANFIQYQSATTPYDGDNPDNLSPLDATLKIIDWVLVQEPGITIYIYENWPDMAPFMSSGLDAYNDYTRNEFHQWWVDYRNEITAVRRGADVRLIPVGSTIARLLADTDLSKISRGALYEDDAPHGRPTIYFLASLVTYTAMYGERPPADFVIPSTVHSLVRDNYAQIIEIIWDEVGLRG